MEGTRVRGVKRGTRDALVVFPDAAYRQTGLPDEEPETPSRISELIEAAKMAYQMLDTLLVTPDQRPAKLRARDQLAKALGRYGVEGMLYS